MQSILEGNEEKEHIFGNETLFENVYKKMFENIFNPILDRFRYPSDIRQYVMMYYLNGINAIVSEWLKNGCDKPIKDLSKIVSICVFGLKDV